MKDRVCVCGWMRERECVWRSVLDRNNVWNSVCVNERHCVWERERETEWIWESESCKEMTFWRVQILPSHDLVRKNYLRDKWWIFFIFFYIKIRSNIHLNVFTGNFYITIAILMSILDIEIKILLNKIMGSIINLLLDKSTSFNETLLWQLIWSASSSFL